MTALVIKGKDRRVGIQRLSTAAENGYNEEEQCRAGSQPQTGNDLPSTPTACDVYGLSSYVKICQKPLWTSYYLLSHAVRFSIQVLCIHYKITIKISMNIHLTVLCIELRTNKKG